jgi:hypothetical protein
MQELETGQRPSTPAGTPRLPAGDTVAPRSRATPGPQRAEALYAEATRHLQAGEDAKAFGQFWDAADLGHGGGAFKAALMSFVGGKELGRDTAKAAKFARQCLELDPPTYVKDACKEILSESLGTQNALRLLKEDDASLERAAAARRTRRKLMVAGAGAIAVLAVVATVATISWNAKRSELDVPPAAGTAGLISAAEAEASRREGLALLAGIKSAAASAEQAAKAAAASEEAAREANRPAPKRDF